MVKPSLQKLAQRLGSEAPPSSTIRVLRSVYDLKYLFEHGKMFESDEKEGQGFPIGVAVALQDALGQVGPRGIIATLPYLIAGKAHADEDSYLRQYWLIGRSEEYVGIDIEGTLGRRGQGVVFTLHGGGLLTPKRIRQAYSEGLTPQRAAKLTGEEFSSLLKGVLPSGGGIPLYAVEDVGQGRIANPFGKYAVWMPAETAQLGCSGYHSQSEFMANKLVLARAGTLEHLEAYCEKEQGPLHHIGNWHRFGETDFRQPQGRLLSLETMGVCGHFSLHSFGRFVGVTQ